MNVVRPLEDEIGGRSRGRSLLAEPCAAARFAIQVSARPERIFAALIALYKFISPHVRVLSFRIW